MLKKKHIFFFKLKNPQLYKIIQFNIKIKICQRKKKKNFLFINIFYKLITFFINVIFT